MKRWIALIVTNAIWAGWAVAQTTIEQGPPLPNELPITAAYVAVGESPSGRQTILRTDEDGYVICSPGQKPTR